MRTLVVAAIGIVAFASGVMLGFKLDSDDEAVTPQPVASGLPMAVEASRTALLAAAESGDYEAVRALIPVEGGFAGESCRSQHQ